MKKETANVFTCMTDSANGDFSNKTHFFVSSQGSIVKATYYGGNVKFGQLIGLGLDSKDNTLNFCYNHITYKEQIRSGLCTFTLADTDDGKICLIGSWYWTECLTEDFETVIIY